MKKLFSLLLATSFCVFDTNAQTINKNEKDLVFQKVEVEAEFPGGMKEWKSFLEKKLNGNVPKDNNAPKGIYTVLVKFLVDIDGSITDIKTETFNGYGTEDEVIRIMKKSPKWIPAKQNGLPVKFIKRQPINFVVQ